jgi:hypothetical protein
MMLALALGAFFNSTDDNVQAPALTALKDTASLVGLLRQLRNAAMLLDGFGEADDFFTVGINGCIGASARIADIRAHQNESLADRGAGHRTLMHSTRAIWNQQERALSAIEKILAGASPRDQRALDNTLFSLIPETVDRRFWSGLWARLRIANLARDAQEQECEGANGICLLDCSEDSVLDKIASEESVAFDTLTWEEAWYHQRIGLLPDALIVERPLLDLGFEERYATSFMTIGDSLNWFVETSVMEHPNSGGVRLPAIVFQNAIARPFETSVIEKFRKHGFLAGGVSESGVWHTQNGIVDLNYASDSVLPGEIDCLAELQSMELVFVVECKVLNLPLNITRVKNLYAKLGESDSEGFHQKLQKKAEWLSGAARFSSFTSNQIVPSILLDRKVPGMHSESMFPILEVDRLDLVLDWMLSEQKVP